MSVSVPDVEPWDVPVALRDLCLEMLQIHSAGGSADAATVKRWHTWLYKAGQAYDALAISCEHIAAKGATPEHLDAMKQALTTAMGQSTYWARADRW